jgi:chaperonin cofactor prefoldin
VEVGKKLSNANKEREDSWEDLKMEVRKPQEQSQKMAKELEEVVKMLRKVI